MKTHPKNVKSGLEMMPEEPIWEESGGHSPPDHWDFDFTFLPRSSIRRTYNGRAKKAAALLHGIAGRPLFASWGRHSAK
jgi:hypothetical protein